MYSFEFIPDYWQEEWNDESVEPFIVEYDVEGAEPEVGLMDDSFDYRVMHEGKDITDELNSLNVDQVEREIKEHFENVCQDHHNDYDVSEQQEWHDFNPDC
jgi:hypothetical protein